jgi:putative membrane protein
MEKLAAIAGACLLIAISATTQLSADEAAPSTADFVKEAAISDMFEIQSSELAEQKSTDEATKAFASRMITDHTKTTEQLKSLVQSANLGVTPPEALDSTHQKLLDKLKSESGSSFAKTYHESQVAGHKKAVSLFERYGKGGENAQLKSWAETTLPILKQHLEMAEKLEK